MVFRMYIYIIIILIIVTRQYVYKSIFQRITESLKPNYPTSFINSFIALKSSICDSLLSVFVFEMKNRADFECPVCHGTSTRPFYLSKHIVRCRKNNNVN